MFLSTNEKDTAKPLAQYRTCNDIELHFDDMKNFMDCNRIRIPSDDVMQGWIFINFLAAIPTKERLTCDLFDIKYDRKRKKVNDDRDRVSIDEDEEA